MLPGSLFKVRVSAVVLGVILAAATFGQKLSGTYRPPNSPSVDWSINSHQTLLWGSSPYLPIGQATDADRASILACKSAGISDVIVDLPAGPQAWQEAVRTLEEQHMRYLIRISSLTPKAQGIAVDPASYRITNVSPREHVDVALPGATEALVISALKRDSSIISYSKNPVVNGRLVCDIKAQSEAVILIYPTEQSLEQPDYWEGLDAQRDRLLQALKANRTGPGLRGFVNPLGQTLNLPGSDLRFVPQSPGFRSEFATYLEAKYRNVVGVLRAWSLPSGLIAANETGEDKKSLVTFDDVASFVPLWVGERGLAEIYDPIRNQLYGSNLTHSAIWKDLAACISAAESRRYERLVGSIRAIDDVPVIQEWAGWAVPYEGGTPTVDGIGMRAKGSSPSEISSTAAKATSSDLRWKVPGWLPATDIDIDSSDAAGKVSSILDDLVSLGARGVFFRTSSSPLQKEIAAAAVSKASDISASQGSPSPIYYPENATNPAQTQRLAGGFWWLPAPYDGDRIDFGSGFFGYRMATPTGVTVTIWADKPERVLLKFANPKKVTATTLSGAASEIKQTREGVELSLSETPLVLNTPDEIPVPVVAYESTMTEILYLLEQAHASHREFPDVTMMISDARMAFDRNPGGSFVTLRRLLHQLDSYMGRFTWTELEATGDTNFSEVAVNHGCSNSHAIALHPVTDSPPNFYAIYQTPIHTNQDEEVWLAAKINPEDRPFVSLEVSGQNMPVTGAPTGLYGSGFGWYHLGTTKNAIGVAQFKLLVSGARPDLAADAVLFCPAGFQPNGLLCPEVAVDLSKPKAKGSKKRRPQPLSQDSEP